MLLSQVSVGKTVRVVDYTNGDVLTLLHMGIYQDVIITVLYRLFNGHIIIVDSDGILLALRAETAKHIIVENGTSNWKS